MIFTDHGAERHVLSGIMHSDTACVEAFSLLSDEDFDDPLNRQLFMLCQSLYIRNIKPTFAEVLKEGHTLGFINNPKDVEAIKNIANQYIHDENAAYWAQIVVKTKKARECERLKIYYSEQMKTGQIDVDDYVANYAGDLFNLNMGSDMDNFDSGADLADLGEKLLIERVAKYREQAETARALGKIPLEGVPTGIKSLDARTLGLKPGDLVLLGARTGDGKTAFAMNVAKSACIEENYKALYINTEMSRNQLARRWGSVLSGIPLFLIQGGAVTNEQKQAVIDDYNLLRESRFYLCYAPNLTPNKLDMLVRKAKIQRNIDLVILDYVGRMDKITPNMAEWQVLEQIIKATKLLAQNMEVAFLVLCQLNEDGNLQGAKRMENECDLMLKLWTADEKEALKIEEKHKKRYELFDYRLFIKKARDAESGVTIPLVFDKERQQIREAEEIKTGFEDIGTEVDGKMRQMFN